jgi:hypothetical protein
MQQYNRPTNNSMLFDMEVIDKKHTMLYVKTRYVIYGYEVKTHKEAVAFIQLLKESVDWDIKTHSYDAPAFHEFRQQWPNDYESVNYNPNF